MKPLSRAAATVTTAALAASLGLVAPGHAAPSPTSVPHAAADPVAAAEHVVSGSTVRPDGQPVDNISVIATDPVSGVAVASALSYGGAYELHLPAGSWTLAFEDLGGRFARYTQPEVLVVDGPVALSPVTMYRPSPTAVTAPTRSGSATPGAVLTVTDGVWEAGTRRVVVTHSWLLDGEPVADGASIEVLPAYVGHSLTPVVVARANESLPTEVALDDVEVVKAATSTRVTRAVVNRTREGSAVKVSTRVSAPEMTPPGLVELVRKGKVVASRQLRGGTATLVAKNLVAGRHKLIVRYRGSGVTEASRSAVTKVVVPRR